MPALSPPQIAFLIISVVAVVGLFIALRKHRTTFSGYEPIAGEIRAIARSLRGEVERQEDDIVITGNFSRMPVTIRFSNADFAPGLTVKVQVPSTFSMSAIPAGTMVPGAGRVVLRTNDPVFDSRFTLRSDTPTEARMFIEPQSVALLKQLCCSNKSHLSITHGALEISELVIPEPYTARHVVDHLKQVAQLVTSFREMPGAAAVKIEPIKRERHIVARSAIAVGAAVAVVAIFAGNTPKQRAQVVQPKEIAGVSPNDARLIRDVMHWRAATADDFDPVVQSWLRSNRLEPEGRVSGDFSGKDSPTDVAYLLVNDDGTRRVVLLSEGAVRYDAQFESVAGIAMIPKEDLDTIDWVGGHPPGDVDGDGLLIIRNANDPSSVFAIFRKGTLIRFGMPRKYDSVDLEK